MKSELIRSIQSLITITKDGAIKIPFSPFYFVEEVMNQNLGFQKYNMLARIWFRDQEMLQIYEDKSPEGRVLGGLTGFDHLMIGLDDGKEQVLMFCMDMGDVLPVAVAFSGEKEITTTPAYDDYKQVFHKYLDMDDLSQLFKECFANIHKIRPVDQRKENLILPSEIVRTNQICKN